MKFIKLLLGLFLFVSQRTTFAQFFNVQPCYEYWKLTNQLRKGIKPDAQAWNRLRQFDGYKHKNTQAWQDFVENVTLVYSPGNEELIRHKLKTDLSLRWIVRYAQEEANLRQYVSQLEGLPLMDSAHVYVRRLLPTRWKYCFPKPKVDFIPYDYDASGRDYGITMDLLVSYDTERFKPGILLGHELLHYALAYCRIKARKFKRVSQEHQGAFNAINGISEEGTADLIDKPFLLFDERSPYMLRDTMMRLNETQSGVCIRNLNETFERFADRQIGPVDWQLLMPAKGHVPGMFMARIIQKQGAQDQLTKRIENPFRFFYLYNKAAKSDKSRPPVFSKKAIRFIRLMEQKYYR